jgi:hypothetical protein
VLLLEDVAAPASAEPPSASAASAPTPASTLVMDRNMGCVLPFVRGSPGFTNEAAPAV